jgi:hypothetical protein
MRTSFARPIVTATALFVSALVLQQCSRDTSSPAAPADARFRPVASVDQLMDSIVVPSSQKVFDAVVFSNGALVSAPKSDADWLSVQLSAIAVAEAGNLLMMPPRATGGSDWMQMALALNASAARVADAARRKSIDDLLTTGSDLYDTCTACHEKYLPGAEL